MRQSVFLGCLWVVLGCAGGAPGAEPTDDESAAMEEIASAQAALGALPGERIPALGAFSCDFTLDFTKFTEPVGPVIARDRILMQRFALEYTDPDDPGMIQKHIPFLQNSPTTALAGGRYLFQSRLQAAQYEEFVTQRFEYPEGTQFLDRPEFADPECRDWTVLAARRFGPIEEETAFRTERFDTGRTHLLEELHLALQLLRDVPALVTEAQSRGYSEVQVLHNLRDHKVQLVYFHPRGLPVSSEAPDVAAFGALVGAPPLDADLESRRALTKVFDQTHFTLTTWLPYAPGDTGEGSVWPNSPPLPQPTCGDGVCSPSRGEDGVSCAADCTPSCGDTVCQADESPSHCPTDCEIPLLF